MDYEIIDLSWDDVVVHGSMPARGMTGPNTMAMGMGRAMAMTMGMTMARPMAMMTTMAMMTPMAMKTVHVQTKKKKLLLI